MKQALSFAAKVLRATYWADKMYSHISTVNTLRATTHSTYILDRPLYPATSFSPPHNQTLHVLSTETISLDETIKLIMSNKRKLDEFEKINKIGEGSYGVVYKVRKKTTQDIVALKRVKLNSNLSGLEDGIPSSSLREIAALKNLKHPNILELYEVVHTGTSIYLVFEYLDQDLKRALESTKCGLVDKVAKSYLWQLLKGLAYCHSRRILHRDLKLQNLLVDKFGVIKLADFGLARSMSLPLRVYTKEVVTLWYRPPEILLGSDIYGPAVDIWSLGCIFYEMITKKVLFPGDSEIDQLFKTFRVLGTPNETQWNDISKLPYYKTNFPQWQSKDLKKLLNCEGASDLLSKMLVYDPFKRVSAQDAMKHPYFEDLAKRTTLKSIQEQTDRNFNRLDNC